MKAHSDLYDLVIIGASAVGAAASIYAARRNLKFVVVSQNIGGEVALSGEVENWPGVIHTDGVKLARAFHEHMKAYNTPIDERYEVIAIAQEKNYHLVTAKDESGKEKIYKTKTVLIGSGIHPRTLGVPGEETLKGKGVTYCTVCDGPLFKKKTTATIGAGNSALESGLMMAGIASKVYVLTKFGKTKETKGGFPKGDDILIEKLKQMPNVEIIYNAKTAAIEGSDFVTGVTYEDTASKQKKTLSAQGVMVHIGNIPNSGFASGLKKNAQGEIETDIIGRASVPGIFAAGDVTSIPYKQIVIAAGQGVTATLSAIDYLNRWKEENG